MKLSNKAYDVLKWLALIAFDAVGVAYKALAAVWGFPYGEEVMQTCAIVSVLVGTLIGVSSYNYKKGE